MATMSERDSQTSLAGMVQLDDACLGGERPGIGGRGSPNKVPIVAAVYTPDDGLPLFAKINQISGFTSQAITDWARKNLLPGCDVRSDGLSCFAGVIDAGCAHSNVVVGNRKPHELPQFTWVNTVLGNLKTMINGAHKAFKFRKYASQCLGAFCHRFNRRFDLQQMISEPIGQGARARPVRERAGQALDEAGLIAWTRDNMAIYKAPKTVRFIDALPATDAGKVLRRLLKDEN